MKHSDNGINNDNSHRKKTWIKSRGYLRPITSVALPAAFLLTLTLIAVLPPISPVQATVGDGGNETTATPAPGGASLGPPANETNATSIAAAQSACLSQNNTAAGRPAADAGAATAADNTTTTVAPGGASIGASQNSTPPAPAGNTTSGNVTTATVAPSGASVC